MAEAALTERGEAALQRVAVLIVNYNAGRWLARCVRSVRHEGAQEPAVHIVDNGSTDDSLSGLETGNIIIDRAGANLGFAVGMNRAASNTDRELLLILNPDAEISPDALARLVAELDAHPECVLVSGRVVGHDGREQRGSRRRAPTAIRVIAELVPGLTGIDLTGSACPQAPCELEAVSGACFLVRAAAFRSAGGFDEGYALHFEDLDLFVRLRAGQGTIRWVPEVTIHHAGGVSSSKHALRVMRSKHKGLARYLKLHVVCGSRRWQWPLWRLALAISRLLRTPINWLRDRRSPRSTA